MNTRSGHSSTSSAAKKPNWQARPTNFLSPNSLMLKEWPDHLFSPRTAEAIVEPHGGLDCLRPPLYNTFFTLRIFDYSRAVCLLDCQSHVQNLRRPGPPFP